MYYYYNNATGESQWEYPQVPQDYSDNFSDVVHIPPALMVHAPVIAPNTANASLVSPAHGFSRDPVQTNTKIKNKKRPGKCCQNFDCLNYFFFLCFLMFFFSFLS